MLDLGLLHHLEKTHCEVPIYTKVMPAGLAKGAAKEQMKCSFFNVVAAENTIVVISLNLVLFSSQNVPCVQSIHQEEPRKDSKFVAAF